MPSTKLAFFRFMLIDQMLRNKQKPYPSKLELLEACKHKFGVVSPSTIEKDLNAMRLEFDAPIAYHKKHNGYAYTDKDFRFLSVNLSEDEKDALGFVEKILEQFRGLPIFSEFSDAVDKVLDGLEIAKHNKNTKNYKKAILIDQVPYVKGKEKLAELIPAITNEKVLKIIYQKHNSPNSKEYIIHPYLLKEYKNSWYLIGYVPKNKEVRTYGVDRIQNIVNYNQSFIKEEKVGFDAETFYQHCIGVTVLNQKPQDIILSFTSVAGNYIKNQPLHSSQHIIIDNEKECKVGLNLIVNFELKMLILAYGQSVEVLAPETFRQEIKNDLQDNLKSYEA